ncbi:uncharacterized protein LOC122576923 [Bombus pyrosoma]|uniref:uncharacterized protein LOC122576923 n=1 Tax=Bombus pyrosoma TaxID=396416 RepID=UPI001CB95521|nr:uncharacterized protein LOC122576923 [Bombus pyrosoma]
MTPSCLQSTTTTNRHQKLHYLRTSLTGIAAQYIQSLDTTAANYANALASLIEKFDNTRQICMNIPKMKNDTYEALEAVVVNFKQHLRALEITGESLLDTVLNGMLISQISINIVNKWELTLTVKKMSSVQHLLAFLEKRASCGKLSRKVTPLMKETTTRNRPRQNSSPGHAFTTSQATSTCNTCQGQHPIRKCTTFKAKPVSKRLTDVKEASLCLKCLRKGHSARECKARSCHMCGRRHHTMLHQNKQHTSSGSSTPSRSSSSSSIRSDTSSSSRTHGSGTTRTNSPPSPSTSPKRTQKK